MTEPATKTDKRVCVVVGVGPGNGAALARRFAREGYALALLARSSDFSNELARTLPGSKAFTCDVADEKSVEQAFSSLRSELGEVDTLVYNAGSGVWGNAEEI